MSEAEVTARVAQTLPACLGRQEQDRPRLQSWMMTSGTASEGSSICFFPLLRNLNFFPQVSFEGADVWAFKCSTHTELLGLGVSIYLPAFKCRWNAWKYVSIFKKKVFMGFVADSLVLLLISLQESSSILLTSRQLSNYCKLYFILFFIGLNEKREKLLSSSFFFFL